MFWIIFIVTMHILSELSERFPETGQRLFIKGWLEYQEMMLVLMDIQATNQ
jgi:hypothetical protein